MTSMDVAQWRMASFRSGGAILTHLISFHFISSHPSIWSSVTVTVCVQIACPACGRKLENNVDMVCGYFPNAVVLLFLKKDQQTK